MFLFATKKLGLDQVQPLRAVATLFIVYALLGVLASLLGYRVGCRAKQEQYSKTTNYVNSDNELWTRTNVEITYSTHFLVALIIAIPIMLLNLNRGDLTLALTLSIPWFVFVIWRYRFAMRQLKKWLFWLQLFSILVLAWFFSKTSAEGIEGRLEALSYGFIMVLRALVVVTGFAAISTELRAPLMQQLFFVLDCDNSIYR